MPLRFEIIFTGIEDKKERLHEKTYTKPDTVYAAVIPGIKAPRPNGRRKYDG